MNFEELVGHVDHHVEVVTYPDAAGKVINVAVECFDCHVVLYDRTKGDDEQEQVTL